MKHGDHPDNPWIIKIMDVNENYVKLSDLIKDKKCICIVNIAPDSNITDMNMKQLVELYENLKDKGFTILAFPCGQFND